MPFVVDLSHCLAVHLSSSPLRPSSRDRALWPRENQHWRTKQFAGHLCTAAHEQAWNGCQEDRSLSRDVFSLISVLSGWREHKCLSVWHARTGRHRWRQEEQAWVDLILFRCVVSCRSNEGKGQGQKSGVTERISNGTQETVICRFWPLHLCTCSHFAASRWQLKGSQTGEDFPLWTKHLH